MRITIVLLLCVVSGCLTPQEDTAPDIEAGAVALAFALTAQETVPPAPIPSPDDDDTTCWNCNGTGKVGDGITAKTCQQCNGTGKLTGAKSSTERRPNSVEESSSLADDDSPDPLVALAEATGSSDALKGKSSDGSGLQTQAYGIEVAAALHRETNEPLILFLSFADEEKHNACQPCILLSRLLEQDEVVSRLSEFGIVCTDDVERWQVHNEGPKKGQPLDTTYAPVLVYLPALKPGLAPHQTSLLPVKSADELVQFVREYINAIPK